MWVLASLIVLNLVLATFAWWAATTAKSVLKRVTQLLASSSSRSLAQLDADLTQQSAALSSLSTTCRRLSSRLGMQDVRARRKEESVEERQPEDPVGRKMWLRRQLSLGKMRVIHDREGGATG